LIVVTKYSPLLETRIVLRTMIFGAGVLAVLLLACVGAAAGAADEVNVTFEGHFGGVTYDVAVYGNYAYIG